ncbi:complex I subunit 5 family protein [Halorarius halobius]|uniref:complex I subunit 5 family protein n=1 Tax=Halorarius halobius TaxID=2962671 RepID=UPI0020CDCB2A|nr:proton-conducting transporter membrane subunit [Halorarius halobius]
MNSSLPLVAVALPAVAAVPILATGQRRPNLREAWTFLAALGTLAVVAALVPGVLAGTRYVTDLGEFAAGVGFVLRVDPFGALFALLASALWLVTSLYSVGYVRGLDEHAQTRYFAAFAVSVASALGVAFAGNLLTLFVCYELLTLATYPLVVHAETDAARAAGRVYLGYTLAGGVAVLGGLVVVYVAAGTLAFVPGGVAALAADPALARAAFALLAVGFGVKTAVVPLHGWLPTAMVAPTPVSGLLHAVAVVKSGAFGLGRVTMYLLGPDAMHELGLSAPLAVAAAGTMLFAGVVALRQTTLKRALAYSTVSQLSYIALGFALAGPGAAFGALLHIPAHALMKITLFFVAGVVAVETGVTEVAGLVGIARRLPATMTAFAVGAAGLAGFPLVAGFVSKFHLVVGGVAAAGLPVAAVYLAAGALKLLLFWPMLSAAFFPDGGAIHGESDADGAVWERRSPFREAPPALLVPVLAVAVGAVVLGVVPDALPLWDLADATVAEVFGS